MIKSINTVEPFTAGDHTIIREILHPRSEAVDINYSLAHASLPPGASSLAHLLKESSEVYVIMQGVGTAFLEDKPFKVKTGDLVFIPAGSRQYIRNDGQEELQFLCVVSPPWRKEDEVIL